MSFQPLSYDEYMMKGQIFLIFWNFLFQPSWKGEGIRIDDASFKQENT